MFRKRPVSLASSFLLLAALSGPVKAVEAPGSSWDGTDCSGLSSREVRTILIEAEESSGPPPHIAIGERCGPTADRIIANILESDSNPRARRIAATALSETRVVHRSVAITLARTMAADPDRTVRQLAAKGLNLRADDAEYEDSDVISHEEATRTIAPIVIRMVRSDPDPEFRKIAISFAHIPEAQEIAPLLVQTLESDPNAEVRESAAIALNTMAVDIDENEMRQSVFAASLRALQSDVDAGVRSTAASTLADVALVEGNESAQSAAQALLTALESDSESEVRSRSAFALKNLATEGDEALLQPVLSALLTALQTATAPAVREASVSALGGLTPEIEDEDTLATVLAAMIETLQSDAEAEVRDEAAYSLANQVVESDRVIAALTTALASDPDRRVRARALSSLTADVDPSYVSYPLDLSGLSESEAAEVSWLNAEDATRVNASLGAIVPAIITTLESDPESYMQEKALHTLAYLGAVVQSGQADLSHKNLSEAIALLSQGLKAAQSFKVAVEADENSEYGTAEEVQGAVDSLQTSLSDLRRRSALRMLKTLGWVGVPLVGIAGLGWVATQKLRHQPAQSS